MKIVLHVIAAAVIFLLALFAGKAIPSEFRAAHVWVPQVVTKIVLVALSLAAMTMSGRPWSDFGFRKPNGSSKVAILATFGLGALATIVILALKLQGLAGVMKGYTFPQIVLCIWIWSSVTEEIFTRGWFQSSIAPHTLRQNAILLSGAIFSAMHASLFFSRVEPASAGLIMLFTLIVGLIAATLRAKRDSIYPAIWAHIAFNVGGLLGGIIATIAGFGPKR